MSEINPVYEKKYLTALKSLVMKEAKQLSCGLFLFGSRAMGTEHFASDYDIGVTGLSQDRFESLRTRVQDRLEESIIPWKADIVNFETVSESFRETAMRQVQWWKNFPE